MNENGFYFGTPSPEGYLSLASRAEFGGVYEYIIKGYSSSVTAGLLQRIKDELDRAHIDYTEFYSPGGSDGIFCPAAGFKMIDGTYPRQVEPLTFGARDAIVCMGDFQDTRYLESRAADITAALEERRYRLERCRRFLTAAKSISDDMKRLEASQIDHTKLTAYANRLWKKHGGKLRARIGRERKRTVTCITSEGVELNLQAFDSMCEKVVVISDKTGACAALIADILRARALSSGYDVITCVCPLSGNTEHIIIPELRFGIFVSKRFHRAAFENGSRVYANRFLNPSADEFKRRLDFSRKAFVSLMSEAFSALEKAEEYEKTLDIIYFTATDNDALAESVLAKIRARCR